MTKWGKHISQVSWLTHNLHQRVGGGGAKGFVAVPRAHFVVGKLSLLLDGNGVLIRPPSDLYLLQLSHFYGEKVFVLVTMSWSQPNENFNKTIFMKTWKEGTCLHICIYFRL